MLISSASTAVAAEEPGLTVAAPQTEIQQLRELLIAQQRQIDELRHELNRQKAAVNAILLPASLPSGPDATRVVPATEPSMLSSTAASMNSSVSPATQVGLVPVAFSQPSAQSLVPANASVDLGKRVDQVENAVKGLGGFVFSGDFRYRFDLQARTGNQFAGPLQNARSRYRVRLNVDKVLNPAFKFHVQLSTGPAATETTNDEDFSGFGVKAPFSVAEAWASYTPNRHFAFRFGRLEEVFADNSRLLWDDDIRFNGFEEVVRAQIGSGRGIFNAIELRAAQYILTNPNVAIVSANSPFVAAGYTVGTRVGAADLFHPGLVLRGSLGERWTHQITADVQIYRNPNQIQLASTTGGFPSLASSTVGVALAGPVGQTGNATVSPGGAIYSAHDFQIVRLAYRLDDRAMFRIGGATIPGYLDFQTSRNVGARSLRDAIMATISVGTVRKFGDVRGLYQFAIKDANSLISQFTDDDLGTGSGVNIAVHALRVDIGLTHFLQWQNLFFIQREKNVSSPQELMFVPLQRGANPTFRYLGQLAFTF